MSYLSFVFAVSNAGYGGNFLERVQNCLDNLYALAEKHKLDAEVILVEWNPPADRPLMRDAIEYNSTYIPTRIITVPKEIHDSIPNPHNEKFFEYWAKDVGIRRASGQFILSTNPDNIYSEELISRLAQHDLDPSCFYRINRSDFREGVVFIKHCAEGSFGLNGSISSDESIASPDEEGYFNYPDLGRLPVLHFNASGDFILMHRDAWEAIHGHPEVSYSLTVDGQTVYLAAKEGLRQITFSENMYHQDHGRSEKYYPFWSDKTPYGVKNDNDWGLKNLAFNTQYI